MSATTSVRTPPVTGALAPVPYDEMIAATELWEACIAVLDRYPRIRPAAPTCPKVLGHVTIPQSAVDAADLHFHLD